MIIKKLWHRLTTSSSSSSSAAAPCVHSGPQGEPPSTSFPLAPLNGATVQSACTGPDTGVCSMRACVPDLDIEWNSATHGATNWAYGRSCSLYDIGTDGSRAGEPIADCFGVVSYENHTILAVADGVNWGEPAKRAARCAVLGAISHLHAKLPASSATGDGGAIKDTQDVFKSMLESLKPAQKLILSQGGTLTTLVMTVVARLETPVKWSKANLPKVDASTSSGSSSNASTSSHHRYTWVAMTMTIGDSAAYVYRHRTATVDELTYAAHAGEYRDPRWTPGALGYALGEEPDLSNLHCSLTLLNEGDVVFLVSDGVADNFDPFMLKLGRQAFVGSQWYEEAPEDEGRISSSALPVLDSQQSHAQQMALLTEAVRQQQQPEPQQPPSPSLMSRISSLGRGGGDAGEGSSSSGARRNTAALNAERLVEGLLDHVMKITEEPRQWAVKKQAMAEAKRQQKEARRAAGLAEEEPVLPCLSTDRQGTALSAMPPGKLDHATVAAYQVGCLLRGPEVAPTIFLASNP